MGYTTEFTGRIHVNPPLNHSEIDYLNKFNKTRRMDRTRGPYFVDGTGDFGQGCDPDVIDYNSPHSTQPGLWCQWVSTPDGKYIVWDGGEKFYESAAWMKYLVDHFLKPDALAKNNLLFLSADHVLNGIITAQGENEDDQWTLAVKDNEVMSFEGHHSPVT